MITKEKLMKVYEEVLIKEELRTKDLNAIGFNSKDLLHLMENGTIERVRRGYYSFKAIDDLYLYGKMLISMKEYDKASACFLKCYELNPNHRGACFQLFLRCIQRKNYEKIFEYFEKIYDTDNKFCRADNDYYLFMLGMIIELPDHYKQYVKGIKIENIKVDFRDNRYQNIAVQNKIRVLSLNQNFVLALKELEVLKKSKAGLNFQEILMKALFIRALEKQNRRIKHLISLLNNKQYEEVVEYYESLEEQQNLNLSSRYALKLAKDLVDIKKSGKVPEKQLITINNLFTAIDSKNYELALILSKDYLGKNNAPATENIIYRLLYDILSLIDKEKKFGSLEKVEETNQREIKVDNSFANIMVYLMKKDLENSLKALRNYLENIGKKQYEFLIINLIKISLIDGDIAFMKPMTVLTYLAMEKYEFNISEYIQNFYETLAQNEFDKARVYLDIISKSNIIEQSFIVGLEQALNKKEVSKNNVNETVQVVLPEREEIPILVKEPTKQEPVNDDALIQQKLEYVFEKGLLLLEPMSSKQRKKVHDTVQNIPDVMSFSIGAGNKRQIVLKYTPNKREYIDFKECLKSGEEAYRDGDYETSIKSYKHLLELKNTKTYIYAKIGLAYARMCDKKTAIDYLTVATELNKKEKSKYDYTDFIARLKGEKIEEEEKPYFEMSLSDFSYDRNDYGIEQISEVAQLVSSGLTLEDACLKCNLNEEQKNIITLLYAKEYYAQEYYAIGDQYLRKVEKTKNKSKFVISLLEEVRKRKKFYKNRVEDEPIRLLLVSKAK